MNEGPRRGKKENRERRGIKRDRAGRRMREQKKPVRGAGRRGGEAFKTEAKPWGAERGRKLSNERSYVQKERRGASQEERKMIFSGGRAKWVGGELGGGGKVGDRSPKSQKEQEKTSFHFH